MRDNIRYPLSTNYRKLKAFLDQGLEIVCFVRRKVDGHIRIDVCSARKDSGFYERYSFTAGMMEYLAWNGSLTDEQKGYPGFSQMMAMHGVEFIDLL